MIMCYIYHACSAPSNLETQSCVDSILVSTSGLADVTATAGVTSKNSKDWWEKNKGGQYKLHSNSN
jgi:hypothetical protein